MHLTTLRIDATHDMLDDAVFAGRIHRLKDKKQRPPILRVEHVLHLGHRANTRRKQIARRILTALSCERMCAITKGSDVDGIVILQPKLSPVADAMTLRES